MNIEEFRADMVRLVAALIPDIGDDYRAYGPDPYSDDDAPSMLLTIGADASGWSYQTGDNSYTGGAYGFADWSVVAIAIRRWSRMKSSQAFRTIGVCPMIDLTSFQLGFVAGFIVGAILAYLIPRMR